MLRALLSAFMAIALSNGNPVHASNEMTATASEGLLDAGFGVQLGYRTIGAGPRTIVVLHGGPGFTMDYLADDLRPLAANHTVIFYDQRGTGRSTLVTDADALDAQRFADDLEAVRRHFKLQKLTLLGHSWGAGVAALYAIRYPAQIERLIIVNGIPLRQTELRQTFERIRTGGDASWRDQLKAHGDAWRADPGNAAACRAFYRTWFVPFYGERAAESRSQGDFCAGTPESLRNKIASVDRFTLASLGEYDWRNALRAVKSPALIIHGSKDAIPVASATEWAAALPDARLLVLSGVGHFPYVEAPEEFFPAVERFVNGAWPESARSVGASR